MSAAWPPKGARTAAHRAKVFPMSAAWPPKGARTAARRAEVSL